MNKGELVDAVAAKANITKKQADEVISAFLSVITEAVANGEKVTLIGFGSFERRERSEREGRNPKTNEPMTIPATSVPAFSAGKQFR
ncbi:MAG: HU family DNA-binding protein, partial [Nostoc sp.]